MTNPRSALPMSVSPWRSRVLLAAVLITAIVAAIIPASGYESQAAASQPMLEAFATESASPMPSQSPDPSASPSATPSPRPVTTEVSDVRGVSMESGGKAMVTYEVTHDFNRRVEPFTALPGARIPRTEAFDGTWADGGFAGAWLAPAGSFGYQFQPTSWMVESAYFTNALRRASEAVALDVGDRFELAMGSLASDAPLPARPRVRTDGVLAWDSAVDDRVVTARYGQDESEMDALFFRADIVARGGDVDAREDEIQLPPFVIDLPRSYPKQVVGTYIVTVFSPYSRYVSGMTMRVLPAAGKAVLTASVRGYIHEARERILPGGADIKEWHLPLQGVIMLSSADDAATPVAAMGVPAGGEGIVGNLVTERHVRVDPGETLTVGRDVALSSEGGADEGADPVAGPDQMAEIAAADSVDRTLSAPVELVQGGGRFRLIVDPDFRGEGVLALRSLRRGTGATYADAFSVPYARVDGEVVKLDRSRLVDLRVVPQYRELTVGFTGTGGSVDERISPRPLHKTRTLANAVMKPGVVVEAVYDLGAERYMFVTVIGAPDPALGTMGPDSVFVRVQTISFNLNSVQALPVYHFEVPEGQVVYADQARNTSFQAPLDLLGEQRAVNVGNRRLTASVLSSGRAGTVTVLPAPAALTAAPAPDPDAALEGPIALLYAYPEDHPAGWNRSSIARLAFITEPEPLADPKPIGSPCGDAQAVDQPVPDAMPAALDVVEAWFDADEANLYATLKLRSAPTLPPPDGIYRWTLHWVYGHTNFFARANFTSDGRWTFDYGGYNNLSGPENEGFAFFKLKDVTGDTLGEFVRISVPRRFLKYADGEVLLDTGAHSWMGTPPAPFRPQGLTVRVDSAPHGTDPTFGTGGAYVVARCGLDPSASPTPTESAIATESPSSSPSESPFETTAVSFTGESHTSGQYSDETLLEARLTDSDGDPIAGADMTFDVTGADATRTLAATTDNDGVANVTPVLDEKPGTYQLTVRYAGSNDHAASSDTTVFVVDKEDTDLDLAVDGKGSNRTLTARLSDRDMPTDGIVGRTIDFYDDSEFIGSATTDDDGVAALKAPPRYRGGKHDFEARFSGDDYYLASSDRRPT